MIRALPKPSLSSLKQPKHERLLKKGSRMTLALGMICKGGVILAADTRVSYGDPNTNVSDALKIDGFDSKNGTYAITHSSDDVNAAKSLIAEIRLKLETEDVPTFVDMEKAIKAVMREWYVFGYENRPNVQLLVGASLQKEKEHGLFLCEPPNTTSRVWDNYKAIGGGWVIADPIYDGLFRTTFPAMPHASLCQISYLMHKAKQVLPGSVGGDTDVAVLTKPLTVPYWINRVDMKVAEGYGMNFDHTLSTFASLIMSGNHGGTETIMKIADGIYSCGLMYGRLEFRCQFPDKTILYLTQLA